MTPLKSSRHRDALAARLALVGVGLIAASLVVVTGARFPAPGPPGPAPSSESFQTAPAGGVDGLATTNGARSRLLPAGSRVLSVGLAAGVVTGTGPGLADRGRRHRRAHLVLDDVGDRWRALLIGAPPAVFAS